ncbi:hypothetical protein HMPREF0591_6274, partial [Mycobacterium parascrofulaceum ATCC BAA-614]
SPLVVMVATRSARRPAALAVATGRDGGDPQRPASRRARGRH